MCGCMGKDRNSLRSGPYRIETNFAKNLYYMRILVSYTRVFL